MKILLVSDSHGDDETLRKIANKHYDCDAYIHCGDSTSNKENISPFVAVKGNCDYFSSDFSKNLTILTPLGKAYIEHIPFYTMSINDLKKHHYAFYFYGHTHIKKDETIDGIRAINPGSILYPRDGSASYAIVDIDKNNINVKFYKI